MFHLGTAGYPGGSKGPIDALERLRARGLDALEIQFVRRAGMREETARDLGARARAIGVLLSVHAPYYINFNSRNPETVGKSVGWVTRTAEAAHSMGAGLIVIHAALYHGNDPREVTETVIDGVRRCLSIMSDGGYNTPLIGLEVMGKKAAWGRISEIGEVVNALDHVVPVVDFAHLHAFGGGALRSVEDVRRNLEEVRGYYQGPLHCHYSSVEYGDRGERRHLPLEAGEPRFELVAEALLDWERDVTIISETPCPVRGAEAIRKILGIVSENRIQ